MAGKKIARLLLAALTIVTLAVLLPAARGGPGPLGAHHAVPVADEGGPSGGSPVADEGGPSGG